MVFGLPSIGESSWGQKILDSINAVKTTADAAQPASTLDTTTATNINTPASETAVALSATYAGLAAAVNNFTGKIEVDGGFTNSYDTDVWIAGATRTNPANNSQGLYIQHRVAGDLGGLVNDAGASELRLSGVSNTGAGQSAHENSLVVTGGVNDAGTLIGVLANFHTSGTPTGDVDEVSLFRASQIPTLPPGFTIQRAVGLVVDQQIVGVENFSVYAPDGNSVFGKIVPKAVNDAAVLAKGLAAQVGSLIAAQNSGGTTLFKIDPNGTGGVGATVAGSSFYVNNNLASTGTVGLVVQANAGQTASQQEWLNSAGAKVAGIDANGQFTSIGIGFVLRNSTNTGSHFSIGITGPRWNDSGLEQTTVGAAGAAAALPATPTKYLRVRDSANTVLVVPAYAAS